MASNIKKKSLQEEYELPEYWKSEKWEDECGMTEPKDRVKLILMHFAYLHFTVVSYKLKEKTPHQQKDYSLFYCCGLELNLQYLWGMPVFQGESSQ